MKLSLISVLAAPVALLSTAVALQEQVPFTHNKALFDFHKQLVEIESVTGNEYNAFYFLKEYLESQNFTVEVEDVEGKNRKNIYAYPGLERNTRVLVTSHIDTVPPYFPYSVEGDRIYGRGSVDAKASVAAQVFAVEELLSQSEISEGDVGLLYVVDEEVTGKGMKYASNNLGVDSWETVIFGEPTELKLGVGHKGIAIAKYEAHGLASHSGYPELGRSATKILVDALHKLMNTELPYSDLLGPSTLNVGIISGGVAANVVPANASATVSVRVAADLDKVVSILRDLADSSEYLSLDDNLYQVGPQYLDYEVPGFDNIILAYSTDIPNLPGDFTRYLYGPGSIFQAHSATEYVTFSDITESVGGIKKLIKYSLKK